VWLRTLNGIPSMCRRDGPLGMISAQPQPAKLAWQTGKNVANRPFCHLSGAVLQ
jgi:hypothetical protein